MPAACVEACLFNPSSCKLISSSFATVSSVCLSDFKSFSLFTASVKVMGFAGL